MNRRALISGVAACAINPALPGLALAVAPVAPTVASTASRPLSATVAISRFEEFWHHYQRLSDSRKAHILTVLDLYNAGRNDEADAMMAEFRRESARAAS